MAKKSPIFLPQEKDMHPEATKKATTRWQKLYTENVKKIHDFFISGSCEGHDLTELRMALPSIGLPVMLHRSTLKRLQEKYPDFRDLIIHCKGLFHAYLNDIGRRLMFDPKGQPLVYFAWCRRYMSQAEHRTIELSEVDENTTAEELVKILNVHLARGKITPFEYEKCISGATKAMQLANDSVLKQDVEQLKKHAANVKPQPNVERYLDNQPMGVNS